MATLPANAGHPTLVNWAKFLDPNGKPYKLAELLNQSNELLQYIPWMEGNLATGHKAAVRAGLPTVQFRRMYQGVPVSKSDRAIIEDVCAEQVGRNEIDRTLAELNGDVAAFRMSEALGFVEAQAQACAQALVYGDQSANKDGITGLTPRYNNIAAVNGVTFNTAANIIDAGGTGSNNTSVWLVVMGSDTVTGIFPKGSKAGLQHEDLGLIDAFDINNNRYRAYAEAWTWQYGFHIKDWRYAVRIANINVSDLINRTGTQVPGIPPTGSATQLIYLMSKAMQRIPSMGMGMPLFLASRTVKEMLSIQALDKSQNALSFRDALNQFGTQGPGSSGGTGTGLTGGRMEYMGIPILTVDRLLSTEARVV